jgi:RNA-directed DNA polymerase
MEIQYSTYNQISSYENLLLAFKKAAKHKSKKEYVIKFRKDLRENIQKLRIELLFHSYNPRPLKTFIIRDPKTRKISKSEFKDRIVHHAICNILEPLFNKIFIYDSYANRKNKGTLKALQRFDYFRKKVSKNNTKNVFILKADIKHYFEEVNHKILINLIKRKIKCSKTLWLIKKILENPVKRERERERERERREKKACRLAI